jgi:hypothetical protein
LEKIFFQLITFLARLCHFEGLSAKVKTLLLKAIEGQSLSKATRLLASRPKTLFSKRLEQLFSAPEKISSIPDFWP